MTPLGWPGLCSKFHRVCTLRRRDPRGSTLTNGDYAELGAANRVSVTIEDVKWLVLPRLMAVASDIFAVVQKRKASKDQAHSRLRRQRKPRAA